MDNLYRVVSNSVGHSATGSRLSTKFCELGRKLVEMFRLMGFIYCYNFSTLIILFLDMWEILGKCTIILVQNAPTIVTPSY